MKKFSKKELLAAACTGSRGQINELWPPRRKKMTVPEMLKIGRANKVDDDDLQIVSASLDFETWESVIAWDDTEHVDNMIALGETRKPND